MVRQIKFLLIVSLILVLCSSYPGFQYGYSLYFKDSIGLTTNSMLNSPQLDAVNESVYVIWVQNESLSFSEGMENRTDFLFNKILGDNVSLTSPSQIAATENGNVYMVWTDKKNSTAGNDTDIVFSWSSDAGKSFDRKKLSNNPNVSSLYPQIAATENGNVYMVWTDKKNSTAGNDTDIVFSWSSDAGKSFDRKKLSNNPNVSSLSPQIAATENGNVYLVWKDKKNSTAGNDTDIVFRWSSDAGKSFDRKKLSNNPNVSSLSPQIAATENGNVYLIWTDQKNSTAGNDTDIVFRWSSDAGKSFNHIKLSNNPNVSSLSPQIAATDNGNVYLVWIENGFFFKEIVNYGTIMGQTIMLSNSSNIMSSPELDATDNGNVYLLWAEKTAGNLDESMLFFKHLSSVP